LYEPGLQFAQLPPEKVNPVKQAVQAVPSLVHSAQFGRVFDVEQSTQT
jgi:hypothetical protein